MWRHAITLNVTISLLNSRAEFNHLDLDAVGHVQVVKSALVTSDDEASGDERARLCLFARRRRGVGGRRRLRVGSLRCERR